MVSARHWGRQAQQKMHRQHRKRLELPPLRGLNIQTRSHLGRGRRDKRKRCSPSEVAFAQNDFRQLYRQLYRQLHPPAAAARRRANRGVSSAIDKGTREGAYNSDFSFSAEGASYSSEIQYRGRSTAGDISKLEKG
ncbi:hypothetical protein C0Q70_20416 [Pomacea canaliculata]|uniref:Uncharacterized protein n=1 Tax=Pomacea canaliculata TaxID=400727 RepID=A0A2T7NFL4_POMCA|nr:hypothetical protein C0Q70_20416 [Pomacea canaliculata]